MRIPFKRGVVWVVALSCCAIAGATLVATGTFASVSASSLPKMSVGSSGSSVSTTTSTLAFSPPDISYCGANFFSASDEATIAQSFGPNQECVLSTETNTWVDLVSPAYPTPSPGGAALLVDVCAADDSACLSPSAQHDLSDFTAYPLPDPIVYGARFLGRYDGDTEWVIPDEQCGAVIFDLSNLEFFSDDIAITSAVQSAPSFPADESPSPAAAQVLPTWCPPGS